MALVVPANGENALMDMMLKKFADSTESSDLTLSLYKNDYTPDETTETTDFTKADFTGYSDKTLTRGNWNDATQNASNEGESVYSVEQSWTSSDATSQTIYGYYIQDPSGTTLWAERFSASRTMENTDVLKLTPKISGE